MALNRALEEALIVAAAQELSQRGLRVGARWALELVGGLAAEEDALPSAVCAVPPRLCAPSAPFPPQDESVFQLARLYLDNREFARAAHLLDRHFAPDGSVVCPQAFPPRAFFLRCYALYLVRCAPPTPESGGALFVLFYPIIRLHSSLLHSPSFQDGERRREMQRAESSADVLLARGGPAGGAFASDLSSEVHRYVEALAAARGVCGSGPARLAAADPFLAYLQGVLLKAAGAREEARGALLHAAVAWPLNWSAWVDLAACCGSKAEVDAVAAAAAEGAGGGAQPAEWWVLSLFRGHALLAVHARAAALAALQPVSALFPRAPLLKSLVARALYGLRRFDAARALLEDLRAADPHRVDDADTLSNILYVAGARAPLAALAADAWAGDRYRPEACVAVGNFYSLRGDHEKAVASFRRALRVDAGYATAWTLLGHEFVELRNLPAAMESYRRAVEVDSKDYRAWYGLGQVRSAPIARALPRLAAAPPQQLPTFPLTSPPPLPPRPLS